MIAISSGVSSSLSLYSSLVGLVILSMVFAPQEWKRDKRAIVGAALLILGMVGKSAYAAVIAEPSICRSDYWFLIIECWYR